MTVKNPPQGYEGVTPYLICANAESAIDFYKKAFGAEELLRIGEPGMVGHAEMKVGNAIFMLADEHPEMGMLGPKAIGGSSVSLMVYVDNIDDFAAKAVEAGLEVLKPVGDQFYGDRSGLFKDPFGHMWSFATHIEDLSPDEMKERAAAMYGGG
jgi:PhnB protein